MTENELNKLKEWQALAKSFDSSARVYIKDDSSLMIFLAFFAKIFCKEFMTRFATTFCNRIYIPRSILFGDLKRLIAHEVLGHVKQCRACGLGLHPLVGFTFYILLYAILFFPIKLAYFRYIFERNAEYAALAWAIKDGSCSTIEAKIRFATFAKTVAGSNYLYPWPKKWVLDGFAKKAEKGFI